MKQDQDILTADIAAVNAVEFVSLRSIRPSPENDQLYHPINHDDPVFLSLVESVRSRGILEPIIVDASGWIISGHRRYAAAKKAGLDEIPCRQMLDVSREDDADQFITLLREHNQQREKTFDERVREAAISTNPDEAYRVLVEHREQKSALADFDAIDLGAFKGRKEISNAKAPILAAINKVLKEYRQYWPISLRVVHYALLNDPPLKHGSKPDSIYCNDLKSYKSLVDVATRGRLAGLLPPGALDDDERVSEGWGFHQTASAFLTEQLNGFAKGYYRNLLQSQPNHIELFGEKLTLEPIIRPIAANYTIPLTLGKGMCSLPPRMKMLQRFKKSGKDKLVVLLLSDFDPDGVVIAENFARSMRDDFGVANIVAIRVAVTHEQTMNMDLPSGLKAKSTSTNYAKFARKYGTTTYELEAIPPETLERVVHDAVDSILDIEAFNHEVDQEKKEAAQLDAFRRTAMKMMQGVTL